MHTVVKGAGKFALNIPSKDQRAAAVTFFKHARVDGRKLSGQAFHAGVNGAPILDAVVAAVECSVQPIVELGDHHFVIAEATDAHVMKAPSGRPDSAILEMKDLCDKVLYGG